ncbi:MAG: MBOAT family protein [Lachnospiraceae bacterium]|nr:MBOAT family protein [Lachnospiraceae bacterium]
MVFSSVEFILIFLPVFLIAYYITPVSYRNVILLLGSLIFYAYGEPKFVLLLIVSIFVNYFLARGIVFQKSISRSFFNKLCFLIALILNLALLLVFKIAPGKIGLPLGISFFTFQSISYLIDVYRGEIEAETSFVKLGTYICMFPQLVAGPIVAYHEVAATLNRPVVSSSDFDDGLKDFSVGLILKVLMADRLSLLWNEIAKIGYISAPSFLLWMGSVSYSLQIYFDFFGYSLMAIGLGKMLGFRLPKNFDLPYTAISIREFYRRWHMTLGRWFTKYVYIPLGGSRNGMKKTLRNLFVVWILTSLWHGVNVNFVLWGMLLCFVIMIEKVIADICRKKGKVVSGKENCLITQAGKETVEDDKERSKVDFEPTDNDAQYIKKQKDGKFGLKLNLKLTFMPALTLKLKAMLQHSYVLFIIVLSWTCFAITDLQDLSVYLGRMFGVLEGIRVNGNVCITMLQKYGVTILIGLFLCTKTAHRCYRKLKNNRIGMIALVILFWLAVWYIHIMGNNPFLYFRF